MKTTGIKQRLAGALAVATFVAVCAAAAAAQGHTGHTGQQQPQQPQPDHSGHTQPGDMPYDLHFIGMMMMHHDMGIEMARLAEVKGQGVQVKAFAKKTAAAQEKDKQGLQWHRDNLYPGRAQMDRAQMMEHMKNMPMPGGMKMNPEADMAKLRSAAGREFDRLFLDTMTHHYHMAVDMSTEAATKAEHAAVKEFARQAVQKQQGEIAEMGRIKAALGSGKAVSKTAAKTPARKPAGKKKTAAKPAGHTGHDH